ncbi:MAG: hypothetical protein U0575_13455 [Phycisphaerales bacterium]
MPRRARSRRFAGRVAGCRPTDVDRAIHHHPCPSTRPSPRDRHRLDLRRVGRCCPTRCRCRPLTIRGASTARVAGLAFNGHVLHQRSTSALPSKVRFAIFASNLDEFFMKRVGDRRQVAEGINPPHDALSGAVLAAIRARRSR